MSAKLGEWLFRLGLASGFYWAGHLCKATQFFDFHRNDLLMPIERLEKYGKDGRQQYRCNCMKRKTVVDILLGMEI